MQKFILLRFEELANSIVKEMRNTELMAATDKR